MNLAFKRTAEQIVDEVERFVADSAIASPALRNLDRARLVDEVTTIIREAARREANYARFAGNEDDS